MHDLSMSEIQELGRDGFNDNSRVKIAEVRRGISGYHVPHRFFNFKGMPNPRNKFAAATAAYAFRLKTEVREHYEANRQKLLRGEIGQQCSTGDAIVKNVALELSRADSTSDSDSSKKLMEKKVTKKTQSEKKNKKNRISQKKMKSEHIQSVSLANYINRFNYVTNGVFKKNIRSNAQV